MTEVLNSLSTLMLGIFAGALLTEGAILVPYWRKMAPQDFFRLHGEMGPSLYQYFAPLTVIAVLLALAAAAVSLTEPTLSYFRHVAGLGAALTLALFFVYFKAANQAFADHCLADEALQPELTRWARWHWLRTAIILIAFAAAVMA